MATKTYTISADDQLMEEFDKHCAENKIKRSEAFQNFMKSELSEKEAAFKRLEERVSFLEEALAPPKVIKKDEGDF